jgi:transposase
MAARHGISAGSVSTIWRAFGLKPHRVETFKISPDPEFFEKVRDIVGLYLSPPQNAVVLAVDEKPQIQALNRTQPMLPTTPARATHDYRRHGTTDLFAALDIQTGRVITECRRRHTAKDFVAFLETIDRNTPPELAVHLVLDNLSTHRSALVKRWMQRHPRYTLHFTASYSSWLNLVERWFSELTTKQLTRSSHRSVAELVADIERWAENWNTETKPFVRHKTADEIFDSLARYCSALTAVPAYDAQ